MSSREEQSWLQMSNQNLPMSLVTALLGSLAEEGYEQPLVLPQFMHL